jgi:hypothetical protein
MFTNGSGFFSGIIGSLGYWLNQQGEQRGGQPWYYFALLQIPVYEFLALLGSFLALYFGLRYDRFSHLPGQSPAESRPATIEDQVSTVQELEENPELEAAVVEAQPEHVDLQDFYVHPQPLPVLGLLLFWSLTSMIAYSLAGEKMPWLSVHIALPMLLAAAWGLGFLVDTTAWSRIANRAGFLALALLPVFFVSAGSVLLALQGANPPFAGNTLEQLQATSLFIFSAIACIASAGGVLYLLRGWEARQLLRLSTVTFFALLAVLTARAAYRASFINYDHATEFLVYAHAARGPKDVLAQVEEISRRTTRGKEIAVAYSGDAQYPYLWYFRDYPFRRRLQ